jgi:hypothetical protein
VVRALKKERRCALRYDCPDDTSRPPLPRLELGVPEEHESNRRSIAMVVSGIGRRATGFLLPESTACFEDRNTRHGTHCGPCLSESRGCCFT